MTTNKTTSPSAPAHGMKFDADKPRFSLVPQQALEATIQVLEFGAKKYAAENWRKVDNYQTRYYDAAMRHLMAHRRGEFADAETGLPHLAHVLCCVMFMLELDLGGQAKVASSEDTRPVRSHDDHTADAMSYAFHGEIYQRSHDGKVLAEALEKLLDPAVIPFTEPNLANLPHLAEHLHAHNRREHDARPLFPVVVAQRQIEKLRETVGQVVKTHHHLQGDQLVSAARAIDALNNLIDRRHQQLHGATDRNEEADEETRPC